MQNMTQAAFLIIGNEILSGRTRDANLPALAIRLAPIGLRLGEVRVVRDEEALIIEAVQALASRYHYVFTSGGIGPTHDDITAQSIAKAFNQSLIEHPEALAILEDFYSADQLTTVRRRMARIPEGAGLIANSVSAAPGFSLGTAGGGTVFVMAGVPKIFAAMLDAVVPALEAQQPLVAYSVTAILPESRLADDLAELTASHPETEIGSYPSQRDGAFITSVVVRGQDEARVRQVTEAVQAAMRRQGADPSAIEASL